MERDPPPFAAQQRNQIVIDVFLGNGPPTETEENGNSLARFAIDQQRLRRSTCFPMCNELANQRIDGPGEAGTRLVCWYVEQASSIGYVAPARRIRSTSLSAFGRSFSWSCNPAQTSFAQISSANIRGLGPVSAFRYRGVAITRTGSKWRPHHCHSWQSRMNVRVALSSRTFEHAASGVPRGRPLYPSGVSPASAPCHPLWIDGLSLHGILVAVELVGLALTPARAARSFSRASGQELAANRAQSVKVHRYWHDLRLNRGVG